MNTNLFNTVLDRVFNIPRTVGTLRRIKLYYLGSILLALIPVSLLMALVVWHSRGTFLVPYLAAPVLSMLLISALRRRVLTISQVSFIVGIFMQALFLESSVRLGSFVYLSWFATIPSLITFPGGALASGVLFLPVLVIIGIVIYHLACPVCPIPFPAFFTMIADFFRLSPTDQIISVLMLAIVLYISAILVLRLVTVSFYTTLSSRADANRHLRRLREQMSLNRSLLATIPLPVFIKDRDYRYQGFSDSFLDLLELTPAKVIGRTAREVFPPESAALFDQADRFLANNGGIQYFSHQLPLADGTKKAIRVHKSCIPGRDGSCGGIVGVIIDESDRINREKELQNLLDSRRNALALIGHDLRGPLGAFKNVLQSVHEGETLSKGELLETVREMRGKLDALWKLMVDLLDWAETDQGLADFKPTRHLLKPIVGAQLALLADGAARKGVNLLDDTPEVTEAFGDRRMIAALIRNLVSNAVKFTGSGGSVVIGARDLRQTYGGRAGIELYVADSGIGMTEAQIRDFMTTGKIRSRRGTEGELGTGMGLHFCRAMVERHQGTLRIESAEGSGTTVTVFLPDPADTL